MGFFDSKSKVVAPTTNKQITPTLSGDFGLNLSDLTVASKKGSTTNFGVTVNTTDRGAVAGALDLAGDAIASSERVFDDVLYQNRQTLGEAFSFGDQALRFGETLFARSIDTVESTVDRALDRVDDQSRNTLGFLDRATTGFRNDLTAFARSQSANNDERLVTIGKWVAGATVAVVGLNAFMGRKR